MSLISLGSLRYMSSRSRHNTCASIHGVLSQLELYQPYMTDLTTERHCLKDLVVVIFLSGLDTSISSHFEDLY